MSATTDKAIVHRRAGPPWVFEKDCDGDYVCRQRKHDYRIFLNETLVLVWIGRWIPARAWVADERRIGAVSIEFPGSGRWIF